MELEQLFRELVHAIRASDPSSLHQAHRLRDIQHDLVPYRSVRHIMELACSEDHEMLLLRLCAGEGGYFKLADADARQVFREEAAGINPDLGLLEVYGDIEIKFADHAITMSVTDAGPASAYRPPDIGPTNDRDDHDDDIAEPDPDDAEESTEARVIPLSPPSQPRPVLPTPPPILEPTQLDMPPDREPDSQPSVTVASPPFELSTDDESPATQPGTDIQRCAYCGGSLPSTRQASYCPHCGQNLNMIRCSRCSGELEYGWRHCIACGHPVPEG